MSPRREADAIRLTPSDNVATVLRAIEAGETIRVQSGSETEMHVAAQAVPLCHKISLAAIPPGAPVVKYGEPIGVATAAIPQGAHVHVHNMASSRGRSAR